MKTIFFLFFCALSIQQVAAQETQDVDSLQLWLEEVESTLTYEKGLIKLPNEVAAVNVPNGFKFLNGRQTAFILNEVWGNPLDTTTLGMLLPENAKVTAFESWAFIITYEEMGFVKDDDADDIDYDELIDEMKTDMVAANEARAAEGYEPITLVGWASQPFYDADKKVLHWAKELKFGESPDNTLNYNVRILGRKGVLVLNAVGTMDQLSDVKTQIPAVTTAVTYTDGNKYADFDPEVDEIAAWTIGGLVAGKVLAKVGFFALILKNIKLIGLALVGLFTAGWKWYKRRTETPVVKTLAGEEPAKES